MTIKKTLQNEDGILILDFIFATMVVFSLSAILFSFAFTFSIVEVVQYISYATARNYSLAHLNESRQRERAEQKFQELTNNQVVRPLVTTGWFEIGNAQIGDQFNNEYNPDPSRDSDIFVGARIPFSAPILFKRIPLLGATASDGDQFTANIQSFLAREPTFSECKALIEQRKDELRVLGLNLDPNEAVIIMDNGC